MQRKGFVKRFEIRKSEKFNSADRTAVEMVNTNVRGNHGFIIRTNGMSEEALRQVRAEIARHKRRIMPTAEDKTTWRIE